MDQNVIAQAVINEPNDWKVLIGKVVRHVLVPHGFRQRDGATITKQFVTYIMIQNVIDTLFRVLQQRNEMINGDISSDLVVIEDKRRAALSEIERLQKTFLGKVRHKNVIKRIQKDVFAYDRQIEVYNKFKELLTIV